MKNQRMKLTKRVTYISYLFCGNYIQIKFNYQNDIRSILILI